MKTYSRFANGRIAKLAQASHKEGNAKLIDAAITFAIRVASAGMVFLLQVFLARIMPLNDYGYYVTTWTWLMMLGAFSTFGFSSSAVRFLPRYIKRERNGTANAFWHFGLHVSLIASFFIAGLILIVGWSYGGTGSVIVTSAIIIAAVTPFLAVQEYLIGVARSHGWFKLASVPIYICQPLLIFAGSALIWLTTGTLNLINIGIVIVFAIAIVTLSMLVIIAMTKRLMRQDNNIKASAGYRSLWLKASMPLVLVSGTEELMIYCDVLILGAMVSPQDVSIYFVAARALALANFVYYAFYFISARNFSIANAMADREKLQQAVWQTSRATFWFTLTAVLITLAVSPWLLAAFGEKFAAGQSVMWILGAGIIARSLSGQANELLITTGKQKHIVISGLVSLTVNGILSVMLIPQIGIKGAAIATAFAMLVRTILLCNAVSRTTNLQVISLAFPTLRLPIGKSV